MIPRRRRLGVWAVLSALIGLTFIGSILVGSASVAPARLWNALCSESSSPLARILWELRLPRALLALLVGASLGLSGAAMQGLMHNPLIEPGIGGVSAGASLAAVMALYAGVSPLAVPLSGMIGALAAVWLVEAIGAKSESDQSILLAGLLVTTACNALIALALNLSPNPLASLEIVFWLLGSLTDRSMEHVRWVLPPMAVGAVLVLSCGRELRAWTLGEEAARSLGIGSRSLRLRLMLGSALAVGAAASVSGSIGFVGLFVPHLMRRWVQSDPARLLPASAAGGALVLSWADVGVRYSARVMHGTELKLGVMTALLGTPLLLLALRRRRITA
jgi:iron complex transport system permease protein